jgi:hypothetical protein
MEIRGGFMNYHMAVKHVHLGSTAYSISYVFGMNTRDKRQGRYHYNERSDVIHKEILQPKNALTEYSGPQTFIDAIEEAESRRGTRKPHKYARTLRRVVAALPNELTPEENIALAKKFANYFVEQGMCAAFAVHDSKVAAPEKYNPHIHILLSTRRIDRDGKFSAYKCREWDKTSNLERWRKELADIINNEYERKGMSLRVDHRSFARQGIDREARKWLTRGDYELEQKGITTARGNMNRAIDARNAEKERIEAERKARIHELQLRERLRKKLNRGNEFER